MIERRLLQKEDFILLIPLVVRFSTLTKYPLKSAFQEVSSPQALTQIAIKDGKGVAYLSGYFLSEREFVITQAYNGDGSDHDSITAYFQFEEEIIKLGGRVISCLFLHDPTYMERFGFKKVRTLMAKEILIEEHKEEKNG